ncbi:hypothetical protein [Streptosporangium carneum]|uniref:Uncharacterized protein n=1 Tax=Streptosporangium carneum TaxID=47481 RepID=A0A9W6HY76_9ACTN|nr:hypothetical protein [Streptosporangium carneum]GLK07778.1 hypothetical protein GCM10017600_11830 [Streptosporangium carneum]
MRLAIRFAVASTLAAGILGVTSMPSSAATGTLTLSNPPSGPSYVHVNPPRGCITGAGFNAVTNNTNAPVTVYADAFCQGFSLVVTPGTTPTPVGPRLSVSIPF